MSISKSPLNLFEVFEEKLSSIIDKIIFFGIAVAGIMWLVMYMKAKNRKKFCQGEEYGSATWGSQKDIEPYMDLSCAENNVILTKTESLTMGKPSAPKG